MAGQKIVAFPHITVSPGALGWSPWEIVHPSELDFSTVADRWDYAVDLHLRTAVECPASAVVRAVGRTEAADVKLVGEVVCRESAWRSTLSVPLLPRSEGVLGAELTIPVPGNLVDGRLVASAHLVGPGLRHGHPERTPGARLAKGPIEQVDLSAAPDQLPITPVSFQKQGWNASPWRFMVDVDDLQAPYGRCARLYLNSDLPVAQELMQPGGGELRRRALASVRRDVVLALLLQMSARADGDADLAGAADCEKGSLGQVAEQLCRHHFGNSLLATARRISHAPANVVLELEESVGYYGGTQE